MELQHLEGVPHSVCYAECGTPQAVNQVRNCQNEKIILSISTFNVSILQKQTGVERSVCRLLPVLAHARRKQPV